MPTGSLCAERNVIGSALAADMTLKRQDLKLIAVFSAGSLDEPILGTKLDSSSNDSVYSDHCSSPSPRGMKSTAQEYQFSGEFSPSSNPANLLAIQLPSSEYNGEEYGQSNLEDNRPRTKSDSSFGFAKSPAQGSVKITKRKIHTSSRSLSNASQSNSSHSSPHHDTFRDFSSPGGDRGIAAAAADYDDEDVDEEETAGVTKDTLLPLTLPPAARTRAGVHIIYVYVNDYYYCYYYYCYC